MRSLAGAGSWGLTLLLADDAPAERAGGGGAEDYRPAQKAGAGERGAGGAEDGRTAEAEEEALSPKPPAESGFS